MKCKKCGQEVDKSAVVCTGCGCKIKKAKWWLWVIVGIIAIAVIGSSGGDETTSGGESTTNNVSEEIVYEIVDLQTMYDELKSNAMKAENNYKNKYVEVKCKIKSFDSDGSYIAVEPVNASEWNFESSNCYIKNEEQKTFLLEQNVGDTVTIKGKIKSVGEILGYGIDIAEVY